MPILRAVLAVIGLAALCAAVIAIAVGVTLAFGLWLFVIGLVLTLGVFFERVRYKMLEPKAPGAEWVATSERFIDPTSGRMVRVYTKPTSGERLYVDEGQNSLR